MVDEQHAARTKGLHQPGQNLPVTLAWEQVQESGTQNDIAAPFTHGKMWGRSLHKSYAATWMQEGLPLRLKEHCLGKVDADYGIEEISHSERKVPRAARDINQQAPTVRVTLNGPPDKGKLAPRDELTGPTTVPRSVVLWRDRRVIYLEASVSVVHHTTVPGSLGLCQRTLLLGYLPLKPLLEVPAPRHRSIPKFP
jgi:hypothetical protein